MVQKNLFLIGYTSPLRLFWNLVVLMAILAYTYVFSYRITFHYYANDAFYWVITAIFSLDILYNFSVETKHGYRLLRGRREIGKHYVRRWFAVDLLAAAPLDLIFYSLLPANADPALVLLIQGVTLVKLVKAVHILQKFQAILDFPPAVMRLIAFGYWFAQIVHLMALGWIIIGAAEPGRSPGDQYLRALYWVTTTVATIGYGDYSPSKDSNIQIIYTVVVQILGVGMYTYIIGNVSGLIANLDLAKAALQRKREEIGDFMKAKKMTRRARERVVDYFTYLWENRRTGAATAFLDELPVSLRLDVLMELNEPLLRRVELFKNLDDHFIRALVQALRSVIYVPGDEIIRRGEAGDCMYFMTSGHAEVLIEDRAVAHLGPGSPFGETALLTDEPRSATIRAIDYCDLFILSRADFDHLRRKFPDFDRQIQHKAAAHRRDNAGAN